MRLIQLHASKNIETKTLPKAIYTIAVEEQPSCIAMYNAWWGLKQNPFSLSPDPAFFYRSQQHEEAFANLIYGIESRKGFIALTGRSRHWQDHRARMSAGLPP